MSFFECRGRRRRVARFSGAGGGLTKRGRGGGQHQKKVGKRVTRSQVDEGKEDGKVILPAADPNPHPTLFHALVGPSAKKKGKY